MSVFQLARSQYQSLYKIGLVLIVIGLPLSRFLMSLGGVFLIISWVLKGSFKESLIAFWNNKPAVSIVFIFVIHLVGLVYSNDLSYAFKDLKIKLPLIIYPVVISGMPTISKEFWRKVFYFFVSSCLIGSVHSSLVYFGIIDIGKKIHDYRDAFVYVSHIRFSLFICLSVFVLLYYWLRETSNKNRLVIYLLPAIWFVLYIFLLGISTGVLILIFGSIIFLLYQLTYVSNKLLKVGIVVIAVLIPATSYVYLKHCLGEYYDVEVIEWENLEHKTINGRYYKHSRSNKKVESGNYVWIYVCEEELRKEWNLVSSLLYDSADRAGQQIKGTLIRYLTSKGLRKDSVGISKLTDWDIENVESGIANINYLLNGEIRKKIDQTIFEFDTYMTGGNPSGNSVTQKIEFWRTAVWIIKSNFWLGVGTGDTQQAFDNAYKDMKTSLGNKYRLRAHNQFLTMFIAFGLIGFCAFLFFFLVPISKKSNYRNLPYFMFFFVITISFMTEDTLETQAGVTFYAFFSCFFLLFRKAGTNNILDTY